MGSTVPPNKQRRVTSSSRYRDLNQPFVGARLTADLEQIRFEINKDRTLLTLPAPTGLHTTPMGGAIRLDWNELPESYRKSIDGAQIWRANSADDDRKDFAVNNAKTIIVPLIRSTTHTDAVGNSKETWIYWVLWINLDGEASDPSSGATGKALYDDAAPGPVENLHVLGGDGRFTGSWSDPLTNIVTLDGFAQQYSTTSNFTTAGGNICITWLLGKIYTHGGSDPGKTYWFRYVAHNQSGDTTTNNDPRLTVLLADGWGPWSAAPENPVSSGWPTGTDTGPPSSINTAASANGLSILFGAEALINGVTGEEGQLRIKREDAPQANVSNLTTPDVDIDHIAAITGCRFTWVAPKPGRYFYSWRLRNAFGWSEWSSDPTLLNVTTSVQTTNEIDSGPPQDWTITTGPGTDQNSVFIYTSRPKVNGANLLWVFYQVKDTSVGAWRTYDENAGAAETYYDGSAINHKLNDDGTKLYRESGVGFGSAKVDDMLLVDVRGGAFHRNYCQWALIRAFEGGNAATASYLEIGTGVRPQVNAGLRVKVVKPNWTWNTEGYFGDLPGAGVAGEFIAGKTDQQFVSAPIPIDGDFNSIDARVWFGNHYSISDASSPLNPPTVSNQQVKVKRLRSTALPGTLEQLSVTGANGKFLAEWLDPLIGYETIDDTAVQYATDANFLAVVGTDIGWGHVNTLSSTSPGNTYWFRFAVRNQSDLDSHPTTVSLGPKGWGPWTAFGSSVSSGIMGGTTGPQDTVIPGPVLSLSVTGRDGKFKAIWTDPTTGNLTIDDVAIQYTTDSGFTANAPGSPAKGWGKRNMLESTAPDKTYWFRVAVHNQSGLTSDASTGTPSTPGYLGTTGWGPWTAFAQSVNSGLIPLDPTQITEQLVPNGGFEQSADGVYPDGWQLWDIGNGTNLTWGLSPTYKVEGKYGVQLLNGGTAQFGIASKAFAVREGEQLTGSVWGLASVTGANGFFFRMFFHANDPDFTSSGQAIDLFAGVSIPGGAFSRFEKQFTVPTGMGWCRVVLYNYWTVQIDTNYHLDDCQVLRVIRPNELGDNTIPPDKFKGTARTEFVETFEEETLAKFWGNEGPGTFSIVSGQGVDGGKVLRGAGKCGLLTYYTVTDDRKLTIPFDPRKLYRMTVRMRAVYWTSIPASILYAGILTFDNAKTNIGAIYPVLYNYTGGGVWLGNVWQELTGFFKGVGAPTTGPNPDPTNPGVCSTGTAYFSPAIYVNWSDSATSSDIVDIDDIRIDILEEEQYTTKAPNGTLGPLTYQVYYPWGDNLSSAVSYYWTYTQGTIKADQFRLDLSDGTAYHSARVKALPAGGGSYDCTVYSVIYNRTFSCTITPEAIGAAGTVDAVAGGTNFPSVNPAIAVGSRPADAQVVGRVEWAGGNIWYDSHQYRNNLAPSNAVPGVLSISFNAGGSGGAHAVINNISYNQGTYIATHLAIYIKYGTGAINLNGDMVPTYLSLGSLPSSYVVPMTLADNREYTLTVVAVAECKAGRIFNSNYYPVSKNILGVGILCNLNPADGLGRRVQIGHYDAQDNLRFYGDAYHYDGSGSIRARIGGNSEAVYLTNNQSRGFYVQPGTANPSCAVNAYEEFARNPNMGNALFFANVSGGFWNTPIYGGCLYSAGGALPAGGGGGWWATTTGQYRNFAPGAPYCEKCGYDFWLVVTSNPKWDAYLAICGWCGAKYKKGPKTAFRLLTKEQKTAILTKKNPNWKLLTGGMELAETERSREARLGRSGTRRRGQRRQGRVRRLRSHSIRARRRN